MNLELGVHESTIGAMNFLLSFIRCTILVFDFWLYV